MISKHVATIAQGSVTIERDETGGPIHVVSTRTRRSIALTDSEALNLAAALIRIVSVAHQDPDERHERAERVRADLEEQRITEMLGFTAPVRGTKTRRKDSRS